MANIVPGVIWRPIPIDYSQRPRRRKGRGLIGHVAVSSSKDLRGDPNGNCWTFYLPKEGPAIQQIDLDYVSGASVDGDATMASFESEGGLGSTAEVNAEPWTDNQLDWAARILLHMHRTEGVPLRAMLTSLPAEKGFGTHRLGIDPYRVRGGERWSTKYAKACPGDTKHQQRFEVVRRAQLMAGQTDPSTAPPPGLALNLEDTDMLLVKIVSDDGDDYQGHWLQDSIGYHNAGAADVVEQLRDAKCPEITITRSTHRAWVEAQDRIRGLAQA